MKWTHWLLAVVAVGNMGCGWVLGTDEEIVSAGDWCEEVNGCEREKTELSMSANISIGIDTNSFTGNCWRVSSGTTVNFYDKMNGTMPTLVGGEANGKEGVRDDDNPINAVVFEVVGATFKADRADCSIPFFLKEEPLAKGAIFVE